MVRRGALQFLARDPIYAPAMRARNIVVRQPLRLDLIQSSLDHVLV